MMRLSAVVVIVTASAAAALAQDGAGKKAIEESRKVALQVSQELRTQLITEMKLSGPLRSMRVCRYSCPEITSSQSRRTGWRVAAVSLKPRNAGLGVPDAWEQRILAEFDRRAASGAKSETLEYAEVVSEPQGKYFRYARAMMVEPLCMPCHGSRESLPDGVRAQLVTDYPYDKATGFSVGQVYGIVSIKRPY